LAIVVTQHEICFAKRSPIIAIRIILVLQSSASTTFCLPKIANGNRPLRKLNGDSGKDPKKESRKLQSHWELA